MKKIFWIFSKKEETKEKNNEQEFLPLIKWIIKDKEKIAIIIAVVYLVWVIYQFLKIIIWTNLKPIFSHLIFFSFWNTINDFFIVLLNILIYFILTFGFIYSIIIVCLWFNLKSKYKPQTNKIIHIIILIMISSLIIYQVYNKESKLTLFLIISLYIIWTYLSYFITAWTKWNELKLNTVIWIYIAYWLYVVAFGWWKYYACDNLKNNTSEKNCVLLIYKNDKYWFTGSWDVYNLENFKSYFTSEYFNNLKGTQTKPTSQ